MTPRRNIITRITFGGNDYKVRYSKKEFSVFLTPYLEGTNGSDFSLKWGIYAFLSAIDKGEIQILEETTIQ